MSVCDACPFNGYSLASIQGQNYGCLPTPSDFVRIFDQTGRALSCHENDKRACRGLVQKIPEAAKAPVLPYSQWYQTGE